MKFTTAAGLGVAAAVVGALVYVVRKVGITPDTFNIASDRNAAYLGANAIVQALTGDKNQTVGGAWHDAMNPRAGLAANEYSPAPGIIITRPMSEALPGEWGIPAWMALEMSTGSYTGFIENEGGAAVGRTVSRGF